MRTNRCISGRSGNTAINVVLLTGVLFGFLALAVDLSVQRLATERLASAVDASALAGVSQLEGTEAGLTGARASAVSLGAMNDVQGHSVAIDPGRVVTGIWNPEASQFVPSEDPDAVDAVRVSAEISVATPFAGIAFGAVSVGASASTVAARPRSPMARSECFLPIAIPMCAFEELQGSTGVAAYQFGNDLTDNIGWAHPDNVNAPNVQDVFSTIAAGVCVDEGVTVSTGAPVELGNGISMSTLQHIAELMRGAPLQWDVSAWGPKPARDAHSDFAAVVYDDAGVLAGPIVLFDNEGDCTGVKWNRDADVVGFSWATVFDVFTGPQQHNGLQIWIDAEREFEWPGSGTGTGNVFGRGAPVLVQ